MSTQSQLPATRSAKPTNLVQIGPDVLKVRLEDGFMRCAVRNIRLYLGTELYFAGKAASKAEDKINTQQAGYMKEVAARGGILMCPPQIDGRPNPELLPDGRVKATAVCIVRDNLGNQHVSRMSYIQDSQLVLRQELLNIQSPEIVQILSDEEASESRAALKGWLSYPLPVMPGFKIWANGATKAVRDAIKDANNLHATVLQRAQTKAERLACDHNAAVRHVFTFDQLWQDLIDENGKITRQAAHLGCPAGHWFKGAAYAEISVVFWQQERDQAALNAMIAALKEQTEAGLYTEGEVVESGEPEAIDSDPDDAPRQITQNDQAPALVIPSRQPEPALVPGPLARAAASAASGMAAVLQADAAAPPAPVQAPAPIPAPAPAPINGQAILRLQGKCKGMEAQLPPPDVAWARNKAGVSVNADLDEIRDGGALERLQAALKEAADGAQ